jgi:uncharacterized protein YcbX
MRVAALYRHPVKGFTPESCKTLSIVKGGRVAGDRVLGFRFANAAAAGDEWGIKHEFIALVNTPGLAPLELQFDHRNLRLRIISRGALMLDEGLDEGGRKRMAAAIERYVLGLAENPLSSHPERLPLRVVGDGVTPQYQDDRAGLVTLHSRESLAALAASVNSPDLSELRFRSNIAIEGAEPWAEQRWIGRTLRIGDVEFEVTGPKARCLATHANPSTGERDLRIMETLLTAFPAERPTFAVALTTRGGAGTIGLGDEVGLR